MRAFLSSTPAHWQAIGSIVERHAKHEDRVAAYAQAATDEARAILSESEPWQGNGTSGHWRCNIPNRVWDAVRRCYDENGNLGSTAWAGHQALAESLATFIGEGR